ncbi:MAG: DUF1585 domain-containing protein [Bryobacteraceae bacterium]
MHVYPLLEKFHAVFARREKLKLVFPENRGRKQPLNVELALDSSGEISGIAESAFSSPRDLGAVLARNRQCQECVIKQFFRCGSGRQETSADRPALQAVFARFKDSRFKLKEALVAMAATSAGFAPGRSN